MNFLKGTRSDDVTDVGTGTNDNIASPNEQENLHRRTDVNESACNLIVDGIKSLL